MKKILLLVSALFLFNTSYGQISAKLMRYMDVSESQILARNPGPVFPQTVNISLILPATTAIKMCM